MRTNRAEVICLRQDVELFLAFGFTLSARAAGRGRICIVHADPDVAFAALVTLMAEKRTAFIARIGRTPAWGIRTLAFAGSRLVLLGHPALPIDEIKNDLLVRAAFRRLAVKSEVK